jgi:hypothetical protein
MTDRDRTPPFTTREAILAANGLLTAQLDWAAQPSDVERPTRYSEMAGAAVADHGAGPVLLGLTTIAAALVTALASATGVAQEQILRTAAAHALGAQSDDS